LKKGLQECGIEVDFLLDVDKPWGFGGILEPHRQRASSDERHRFIEYSIAIPRLEKDIGECEDCGGKREVDGIECFHCMGTGRKTVIEWNVINRIAATLHVLGFVLNKPDKKLLIGIDTKRKQLLSLQTFFASRNAPIGATLSRAFGDYVRSLSGQELPEVNAAIKNAYLHMFPRRRRFSRFESCVYEKGQLIVGIPGDSCGLYVGGTSKSLHEASGPMELDCHNVDGPDQQLTLLCGLAKLAGMARIACTST